MRTVDTATACGDAIPIEERSPDEIRCLAGQQLTPADAPVYNPAFDVTPHELVTAIITERGVIGPPYGDRLAELVGHQGMDA